MSGSDDGDGKDTPPRRITAQFGALTFEDEVAHMIRSRGKLFFIDLTEVQISWIAQHAGVIHRRYGGK